jgi:protein CWC15
LLQAEAAHFAKKRGIPVDETSSESATPKRQLEGPSNGDAEIDEEDPEAKRRRILEETRDIDADSDGEEEESSDEERLVTPSQHRVLR